MNENGSAATDKRELPSLLKNISWLGITNAAVKPFWFLFVTAACMRLLGVSEYGTMNAALSLTLIATSTVNLGTKRYTVREVARDPSRASEFFSNFMLLRTGSTIAAWGAAVAIAYILEYRGGALGAVVFAGLYATSLNLTDYCRGIYQALEDLRQESVMLVLEKVLVIGGGLVLLWFTRKAHWTLAGMGLGMLVTTTVNVLWIHRRFAKLRTSLVDWAFLKDSLIAMIPFSLAALFTVIYYRVDMVMIEALLGQEPTGQYGAAFRILEALNMLPAIVATAAVYPRLAKLQRIPDRRKFIRLFRRSMLGLVTASTLIAATLFMWAAFVINLLDPDPAFGPAAGALRILVWSYPFFCANSLFYAALVSLDDQTFISYFLLVAVVVNIGLNIVTIPMFGIEGAAMATVAPELVLTGIYSARLAYRWRSFATERS